MSGKEDVDAPNQSEIRSVDSHTDRKRQRQAARKADNRVASEPNLMGSPNWLLLLLAGTGMILTAYLSYAQWTQDELLFCTEGSACDLVQSSRWSTFFALPLPAWGFLTYTTLALTAALTRKRSAHWKLSWTIALIAVAISTYFNAISLFVLKAICGYCLASYVLLIVILCVVARQKPPRVEHFAWDRWILKTGGAAVLIVSFLQLHYAGVFDPSSGPEDPQLRALAEHLTQTGAKFYGASWCSHCQEQKRAFTASAKRLPFIECSPNGRQGARATECVVERIQNYPTWIISGRRYERGVVEPNVLASLSRFDWEAASEP